MNILLDYFFPITAIEPTPAASTAFLKQVLLVVKPASMVSTGVITACVTNAAVAVLTANTEAAQLFNAGMSKVYIMPMNDLDLSTALAGHESDFFTILISSDFSDADITATQASGNITITSYANLVSGTHDVVTINGIAFTAQAGAAVLGEATFQAATSNNATATSLAAQINAHASLTGVLTASALSAVVTITAVSGGAAGNALTLGYTDNDTNIGATKSGTALTGGDGLYLGAFKGVVGVSSTDNTYLATHAAIKNRAAFHSTSGNKAKNMCYAFGKLLSNAGNWLNQQYVSMPFADDVATLGSANSLFDSKISFVISDGQFGERLALFAAGGKAIVAPYIIRNLQIDMQSAGLAYISGNEPAYTLKQAALLEDELLKVIASYKLRGWLSAGTVAISLVNGNFVATGNINIAEPKALWRVEAEMRQTL